MGAKVAGKVFRCLLLCAFVIVPTAVAQKADENLPKSESRVPRAGKNGVTRPECIHCPEPQYNEEARKAHLSGTVLIDVTVTTEGKVINPIVLRAPGVPLIEVALAQVQKWKFKPAVNAEGKPVDCRQLLQINFHYDH